MLRPWYYLCMHSVMALEERELACQTCKELGKGIDHMVIWERQCVYHQLVPMGDKIDLSPHCLSLTSIMKYNLWRDR